MLQHRDEHGRYRRHPVASIRLDQLQHQRRIERFDEHLRRTLRHAPRTHIAQPPVWNIGIIVSHTEPSRTPMRSSVWAPLLTNPR